MDQDKVVAALAALAHEHRLRAYRLLVEAGPDGLPAGTVADRLEMPPSSLTFHLQHLLRAGLVSQRRVSRQLIYAMIPAAMNDLVGFLTEKCCGRAGRLCARLQPGCGRSRGNKGGRKYEEKQVTVIYHNPACGTSRNVLALIRNTGEEPEIIEYLKTPPTREKLVELIGRMGIPVRDLLRRKGTPYEELGLGDPALTDDQLLDAMMAHPILINRPIVVTDTAVKLCRPSETVLEILDKPQLAAMNKEDGESVVGAMGKRAS